MTDTWTKPTPPFDQWHVDQVETVRLTEGGILRITEDGQRYRIIERATAAWSNDPTPPNPWS